MALQGILFVAGLVLLYAGAESLVRGATRLAHSLGVSALVVGLTVVAFGTSAPELIVSVLAAARGQSDVALGNVVGSNIANIALIFGLSALLHPLRVEFRLVAREIPLMIGVSLLLPLLVLDAGLSRPDGALLLAGFGAYLWFVLRTAPAEHAVLEREFREFEEARLPLEPRAPRRLPSVALVVAGLAGLAAGAHLLVGAAEYFARAFGVSELVIGLTLVAVGTSLPELATSAVAAVRGKADIAVGNIVGSNVFNVLAILGVAALVRPLDAAPSLLRFELPVMVTAAVLLLPLAWSRFEVQRWEGAALLLGYVAFLSALLIRA